MHTPSYERICPTCSTALPNPDDAASTSLQPSEEYKTSVLSGLDPTTIMECASRALSFWTYQTTQEMYADASLDKLIFADIESAFQEHHVRVGAHKYDQLSKQMDQLVNDANIEIDTLQKRVDGKSYAFNFDVTAADTLAFLRYSSRTTRGHEEKRKACRSCQRKDRQVQTNSSNV